MRDAALRPPCRERRQLVPRPAAAARWRSAQARDGPSVSGAQSRRATLELTSAVREFPRLLGIDRSRMIRASRPVARPVENLLRRPIAKDRWTGGRSGMAKN